MSLKISVVRVSWSASLHGDCNDFFCIFIRLSCMESSSLGAAHMCLRSVICCKISRHASVTCACDFVRSEVIAFGSVPGFCITPHQNETITPDQRRSRLGVLSTDVCGDLSRSKTITLDQRKSRLGVLIHTPHTYAVISYSHSWVASAHFSILWCAHPHTYRNISLSLPWCAHLHSHQDVSLKLLAHAHPHRQHE